MDYFMEQGALCRMQRILSLSSVLVFKLNSVFPRCVAYRRVLIPFLIATAGCAWWLAKIRASLHSSDRMIYLGFGRQLWGISFANSWRDFLKRQQMQAARTALSRRLPVVCRQAALAPGSWRRRRRASVRAVVGCLLTAMAAPIGSGLDLRRKRQRAWCCWRLPRSGRAAADAAAGCGNPSLLLTIQTFVFAWGSRANAAVVRVWVSYHSPFCCTTNTRLDITFPYSFSKAVTIYTTA